MHLAAVCMCYCHSTFIVEPKDLQVFRLIFIEKVSAYALLFFLSHAMESLTSGGTSVSRGLTFSIHRGAWEAMRWWKVCCTICTSYLWTVTLWIVDGPSVASVNWLASHKLPVAKSALLILWKAADAEYCTSENIGTGLELPSIPHK